MSAADATAAQEWELLAAGRELSAAVRSLALEVHDRDLPAHALLDLARSLRQLAAGLERPGGAAAPRPRWWDEVAAGDRKAAGRRFRHLSPFGGPLNLLAGDIVWESRPGPADQPGLAARITLDRLQGGPPHSAHGGVVAGLFDEALGAVQGLLPDGGGVTGKLEIRYRALTPLDTELVFAAWIDEVRGRRIHAKATCHAGALLTAEAEGLFIRPVGGIR